MSAEQVNLAELYPPPPLATLWSLTIQMQDLAEEFNKFVTAAVRDPSWLAGHMQETEETHRHAGDEH